MRTDHDGRDWVTRTLLVVMLTLLAGCSHVGARLRGGPDLDNPPRLHDDAAGDERAQAAAQRQIATYYAALQKAEADPTGAAAVQAYLEEGIGLVDSHCLRWFQRLDDFERNQAWQGKNDNVITQLTTALIGVARLHPDVTTAFGAGTTALAGLRGNRLDGLVIAPSSKGVKAKVRALMMQRAAEIRGTDPKTLVAARGLLEGYADLCTYSSAKNAVDTSVQATEVTAKASGEMTATLRAEGTFNPDHASAVLRRLWKPDGTTADPVVESALHKWLAREANGLSITSLMNSDKATALRRRALVEIELR